MKLTVTIAQMNVVTSQPAVNFEKASEWVEEAARRGSDLICFPEMWTTGFNWKKNREIARDHEVYIEKVANLARQNRIWINGSMLALNEEGDMTNCSILFDSQGNKAGIYRKTHLFSYIGEDKHMAPGQHLTTIDTSWGRMGLSVCYDIRFPELFRTYALKGVKVQLSPMAFPYPRLDHWRILARARAIENQMYLIGINQVGSEEFEGFGTATYFGSSIIIDPWGKTVVEGGEDEEMLLTATIDVDMVDKIRNKMHVLEDRRPDLYDLG
ncbi:MAG: carbon-nitrogen family hydrolase [Candidatus Eremiobacteraeota bacterium]|nr:carbon-nitrogen family hydrolase [Candidatus Eremiobacteraeota bacterium]